MVSCAGTHPGGAARRQASALPVFGSLEIGKVLGITIRLHVLLLVLALFLYLDQGPKGLGEFGILFLVVLLHELGHSIVAQRMGIRVVDITLWPLGGVARMTEMPESSRVEGLIAIAGPAVNFALASLCGLVVLLSGLDPRGGAAAALWLFVQINLALGLFNLIPAFPTDGGRILRALLALRRDWLRATEIAVRVGGFVALLCAVTGLVLVFSAPAFFGLGLSLVLVAAFLWWTGRQELAAVRLRHGVSPFAMLAELLRRSMERGAPARPAEQEARGDLDPRALEDLENYRGSLRSWRGRRDE